MAIKLDKSADEAAASFLTDSDRLVFLMEDVARRLRKSFDTAVAQFGLTRTQWRALAYLYRNPGLTQTEISNLLELERATVGQAIDRLAELHLVERRSAKNDRRVWKVHLLRPAIDLLPVLRAEADSVYKHLLRGIPVADIKQLHNTLLALQSNLSED
jgi:MarR family transcriptional regulator for hemolysin